ncbi:MAG: hypothetical protein R3C40_11310, partial [Parvularculaceae bacterium]
MNWWTDFTKTVSTGLTTGPVKVATDAVAKTVTQDIPRIVTRDIPRVVTEDIPRVVTEDIPRIVTNDVAPVVTRDIPDFFSKEVPAFFEDLAEGPDRDRKDPGLPKRRAAVAALRKRFEQRKEEFFAERARLSATRRDYETLAESYDQNAGVATSAPATFISERTWEMPGGPPNTAPEAVENGVRYVLGFVTFNLTEHAWHGKDIRREHDYLNRQEKALKPVVRQLDQAIAEMTAERARLEDASDKIRVDLEAAGLSPTVEGLSEARLNEVEQAARRSLAQKMLGDGVSADDIAFVTGLSVDEVSGLAPESAELIND